MLDFRCPWHSSKLWWLLVFPFLSLFLLLQNQPSSFWWLLNGQHCDVAGFHYHYANFLLTILQIIMLCHKFEWYHFLVSLKFGGSGHRCCYLSTVISGLWHFSPTLSWSGHFPEYHPRMYCYTPKFQRIAVFKVNILWYEGSLLLSPSISTCHLSTSWKFPIYIFFF